MVISRFLFVCLGWRGAGGKFATRRYQSAWASEVGGGVGRLGCKFGSSDAICTG